MNFSGNTLTLEIKGMSNIKSFKNNKRAILDQRTGKMRTLTEPETKQWMDMVTRSFVSQLLSGIPTTGDATSMGDYLRSLIALLPQDDCWKIISEISVKGIKVKPGQEGAIITIERIS